MKNKSYDIFLSYPRKDKAASDKVINILRENGFSVWRDTDEIPQGDSFADVIHCSITRSKVIVAIYSTWLLESEWIKKELEWAKNEGIPIIKVLTDTPEGLLGTRRLSFGTILEMGSNRFEEKFLSLILNYNICPDTTKIYSECIVLRKDALKEHDLLKEKFSFLKLLRIAELGNEEAGLCIETKAWDIDLSDAVSCYKAINSYYIEDLRTELFEKGIIIAEDETLTDSSIRGRGMEKAAFRMMKRAMDLGYNGLSPLSYNWTFLNDDDFEECLDMLGKSSRLHLNEQKNQYNIKKANKKTLELTMPLVNQNLEYRIFISYKRIDKEKVFRIKDDIESKTGHKCWIDLDGIESDAQFANVIIKAINQAHVFLFMYSKHHTEIEDYGNDWTVREINFAQKKRKRIVFINIDKSYLTDWFELMFGTKQQIDAYSEIAMEKLCRDLRRWLK